MIDTDALLAPLSADQPCGEDISYRPEFLELDSLLRGKEETQFSPAVRADWKLIHQRCLELFRISKHLQVATVFCASSLETGGLADGATALRLLSELLERYWDQLYPRLDPGDGLDPLERLNILSALTSPVGTFGDPLRFLDRLRAAPLTASAVLGRLSLADMTREASDDQTAPPPLDPAQAEAAFRDTPPAELAATLEAIRSATAAVGRIAAFVSNLPHSEQAPSFALLLQQLLELERTVAPHIAGAVPAPDSAGATSESAAPAVATGAIKGRADVIATLDRLCAYYTQNEPSSPVPLLLKRARRLVNAEFLDILADLAPDAMNQARTTTGTSGPAA